MKLSCAFSIVVLFVTAVNNSTSSSSTAATNTTSASTSISATATSTTSTPATAANTTAASTSTPATSQTTTPMKYVCIEYTCNVLGCLTNASNTGNCTGQFCTMVQRFNLNQTIYNITAGCAISCTQKDEADGDFTVRTRCCQSLKCNKDDKQIAALPNKNGGITSKQKPLWILSIMLFISAFEILL